MAAPYAWAFGFAGDTGVGDHVASIDESFLDIMDQSDSIVAIQGHAGVQYRRFGAVLDGAYAKVGYSPGTSAEGPEWDHCFDPGARTDPVGRCSNALPRILDRRGKPLP